MPLVIICPECRNEKIVLFHGMCEDCLNNKESKVAEYVLIAPAILDGLRRYARHGVPTGGFLRAVLANDLMEAVGKADLHNRNTLWAICIFIHHELPGACHGSYGRVDAWIKQHNQMVSTDA